MLQELFLFYSLSFSLQNPMESIRFQGQKNPQQVQSPALQCLSFHSLSVHTAPPINFLPKCRQLCTHRSDSCLCRQGYAKVWIFLRLIFQLSLPFHRLISRMIPHAKPHIHWLSLDYISLLFYQALSL